MSFSVANVLTFVKNWLLALLSTVLLFSALCPLVCFLDIYRIIVKNKLVGKFHNLLNSVIVSGEIIVSGFRFGSGWSQVE